MGWSGIRGVGFLASKFSFELSFNSCWMLRDEEGRNRSSPGNAAQGLQATVKHQRV